MRARTTTAATVGRISVILAHLRETSVGTGLPEIPALTADRVAAADPEALQQLYGLLCAATAAATEGDTTPELHELQQLLSRVHVGE